MARCGACESQFAVAEVVPIGSQSPWSSFPPTGRVTVIYLSRLHLLRPDETRVVPYVSHSSLDGA
jgi:hypothetical protein